MAAVQYPLSVYYDRSCPLCRDEMHYLAECAGPDKIRLIDASASDFENDTGIPVDELMTRIYGRAADGTLIYGMTLLRKVYVAADKGWALAFTGWPLLAPLFDRMYLVLARNRYRLPAWTTRHLFHRGNCRDGFCER